MGEIEVAIDAPSATPAKIISVVGNMTSPTTLDDDEPAHLTEDLRKQLEQIAKNHAGMVPLHGRLFAQWLHYVFPRECPFPHKMGAVVSATPTEYGDSFIASKEDMEKLAATATDVEIPTTMGKEELQWMSQWSEDEELMVDYSSEMSGPWRGRLLSIFGLLFVGLAVWSKAVGFDSGSGKPGLGMGSSSFTHSHYV